MVNKNLTLTLLFGFQASISMDQHGLCQTASILDRAVVLIIFTNGTWHHQISGGVQTMSDIVESCPLTRFDGDLLRLHSADDCVVT